MASQNRGIPSLAATLIRPTQAQPQTPPETESGSASESQDEAEGQGGRSTTPAEPKPRSRRLKAVGSGGEVKGRKLSLPDGVFDRLQLVAIQRRTTVSAVATEVLDRNLPRLRIERDS